MRLHACECVGADRLCVGRVQIIFVCLFVWLFVWGVRLNLCFVGCQHGWLFWVCVASCLIFLRCKNDFDACVLVSNYCCASLYVGVPG